MPTTRVLTDEDLMRLPKDGRKYELVDGELRVSPAGALHEEVCANLIAVLGSFVRQHRIGKIFGSNLCYVLPGGNKRAPDVSFVAREVLDKVGEYLQAGVRLVWVIDPRKASECPPISHGRPRDPGRWLARRRGGDSGFPLRSRGDLGVIPAPAAAGHQTH